MERQSLEFAQLVFDLAFVQDFHSMSFWNGNVYPVMSEVCDLLFDVDFILDYKLSDWTNLNSLNFGLLNIVETVIDYGDF